MYSWLVFLHVLGIFGFLIAHGASASVFFALKKERNPEHICTLLQLSSGAARIMLISLLTLFISGIIAGFLGHWWRYGWIWLSQALLIGIYVGMSLMGTRILNEIRMGIGLPSAYGQPPRPERLNAEELNARLNQIHPYRLTLIGFGGLVVIAWLMMFKPF
jgi:NhaP-type Na+/H+ and K+/H+ antiporter